jgi:hypothetical protein
MMNDDNRFDELVRNAVQQYNKPPAVVPRDEMWAAIEEAQSKRALRPMRIVAPGTHRPLKLYVWLGAAAAAVLLVATGVGIGRWSMERRSAPESVAKTVAPAPAVAQAIPKPAAEIESPSRGASAPVAPARVATTEGSRPQTSVRRSPPQSSRIAQSGSTRSTLPGYSGPPFTNGGVRQEGPYQVATIRHLSNAEALLTAFRTDSRDARMDAQLSTWARDLLSNTRLLLDSPAADDPQRARLLGDLELVLAQIVQLSPGAAAQDRELIEGSIRSGQVMTRLRSAIPAGPTRGL